MQGNCKEFEQVMSKRFMVVPKLIDYKYRKETVYQLHDIKCEATIHSYRDIEPANVICNLLNDYENKINELSNKR